jgi:hypothetical protein
VPAARRASGLPSALPVNPGNQREAAEGALPAPYRRAEPITAGHRCRSAGERRRGGRLARITPVDVSAALAVLGA